MLHYIKHLETGGGEMLVYNIYQHIDRDKVQFDFAVNTAEREYLDEKIESLGGRIFPLAKREPRLFPLKLIKTTLGLKKLLKQNRYDIVHIHCSNGQGLYYSNAARECGVKNVIVHIHGRNIAGNNLRLKNAVHRYLCRRYMKAPTEYLACSVDAAEWIYDREIINGKHFEVIKNGIASERFRFSDSIREKVLSKLGLSGMKTLITVGRCDVQKNQRFILEILEKLLSKDDSYRLILVGKGPLENELRSTAKQKGIYDKTVFVRQTRYPEYYLNAGDCFLLPSLGEGFGIAAIEAQANGLNTVISDMVPDEVMISPLIIKLPLSAGAEYWAERIRAMDLDTAPRSGMNKCIEESGFEIQQTADKLQSIYMRLVSKRSSK